MNIFQTINTIKDSKGRGIAHDSTKYIVYKGLFERNLMAVKTWAAELKIC